MASPRKYRDKKGMTGNTVSHSHISTKTKREPNLQPISIWVPEEKKIVKLKVSVRCSRTISKIGLYSYIRKNKLSFKQFGLKGQAC